MTKIRLFFNGNDIIGFSAEGHTGFADRGEDIVCAAISVLTQTAVIGLQQELGLKVDVEIKDGLLQCRLPVQVDDRLWQQSQVILRVMYAGLRAILQEYGKQYLDIEEVEQCG
ncbi:MAG: ribosomal-processing cysteine protease Prp [Candidatus Wallacebacter cryptica]|jgi:uncharacterized protein YsxB (DUF464 family)|nr:ribosomal-processing cysteine protease Prp [Bacillota bacterium]